MQIRLTAPKIWLANEAVDFRKAIDGLQEIVATQFEHPLEDHIYVFYNRAKNKLKLLAQHRNGSVLIYKRLDKKRFTLRQNKTSLYEIDEKQLSWLLAGLDWINMCEFNELSYDDFY